MLKKARTEIIFTVAALIGLLSIALLFTTNPMILNLSVLVPAFGFIIWSLVKSETEGFIKITRMPRAGDPQREFHPVQSFILLVIDFAEPHEKIL